MRFYCILACLLTCIQCGCVLGAENSDDQARLISETSIRWLLFDEWGRERTENPYPDGSWTAYSLGNLREHLNTKPEIPLHIVIERARVPLLSGTYDIAKRALAVHADGNAHYGEFRCIYVDIAPQSDNTWNVELGVGSVASFTVIGHKSNTYYVASYLGTRIYD